jgi:hypothetical protein
MPRRPNARRGHYPPPRQTPPNWRALRIGPSFIKTGKAVLYPASELGLRNTSILILQTSRSLPLQEYASASPVDFAISASH